MKATSIIFRGTEPNLADKMLAETLLLSNCSYGLKTKTDYSGKR